jgi:hypothetical protein
MQAGTNNILPLQSGFPLARRNANFSSLEAWQCGLTGAAPDQALLYDLPLTIEQYQHSDFPLEV